MIFIVNNKIIYENLEYIEKICLLNTSNYNLERITEINNYLNKKEIFFKYLDLLIKNPLEKVTFNLKLKANNLLKLETRLINNYEDYNLKKSISYDEDNLKALNAWGIYTLPSAEEIAEILKENNIDITKGSRSDRETYVGGEEKNPGKIKKTSDKN